MYWFDITPTHATLAIHGAVLHMWLILAHTIIGHLCQFNWNMNSIEFNLNQFNFHVYPGCLLWHANSHT
jgi:hypothetical protein